MAGYTFDTGALIGLERGAERMRAVWRVAIARGVRITVPSVVVAEWWRGQRGPIARILEGVEVESLTEGLARRAGEALGAVNGSTLVDAIVMTSAAQRGDAVYTSDVGDLQRLQAARYPSVRLFEA